MITLKLPFGLIKNKEIKKLYFIFTPSLMNIFLM